MYHTAFKTARALFVFLQKRLDKGYVDKSHPGIFVCSHVLINGNTISSRYRFRIVHAKKNRLSTFIYLALDSLIKKWLGFNNHLYQLLPFFLRKNNNFFQVGCVAHECSTPHISSLTALFVFLQKKTMINAFQNKKKVTKGFPPLSMMYSRSVLDVWFFLQ